MAEDYHLRWVEPLLSLPAWVVVAIHLTVAVIGLDIRPKFRPNGFVLKPNGLNCFHSSLGISQWRWGQPWEEDGAAILAVLWPKLNRWQIPLSEQKTRKRSCLRCKPHGPPSTSSILVVFKQTKAKNGTTTHENLGGGLTGGQKRSGAASKNVWTGSCCPTTRPAASNRSG